MSLKEAKKACKILFNKWEYKEHGKAILRRREQKDGGKNERLAHAELASVPVGNDCGLLYLCNTTRST